MKFRMRDYWFPVQISKYRRLMTEVPTWTRDRLEEWSRARRKAIVMHAYRHVPYYRRLLDEHGICPEHSDRPEVWGRIPTLDKETLRENTAALIAGSIEPMNSFWATTSGSTGMILRILLDKHVNAAAFALFWRCWESGGYWHLGQRQSAMKSRYYTAGWKYIPAIRTLHISPSQMTPSSIPVYRDVFVRYRPRFLRAFPSAAYLFCRLLQEAGLSVHIPMVIAGAEVLYDFQRTEIEQTLGARVYNHYTHWERAASILECAYGRLHCQEDYGHHELLDAEGRPVPSGTVGEITATGLYNRAMPLIRYRTGDLAVWSAHQACPCGQPFPIVDHIEGRQTDYLIRPDGSVVSGNVVREPIDEVPQLLYSQLIQTELDRVEVRLVKAASYRDPEDTQQIIAGLHRQLGHTMRIDIRFCGVEDLERNPIGKIRYCFNRLSNQAI